MFSSTFCLKALAAILPLLSAANAHMIMSSPVPYGKSTLDNSPLIADGSDFPCKQRSGVYDLEGASNNFAAGSTQTLSFIGSAVHGGGSCQVSLTTDKAPTASTKWMVIHSIQGNCPSNVTGNLDANADGTGAAVFDYTIPSDMAAGDYTIAWSWVNKVGNREFYMNCGPATITAASKKRYAPAPKVSKRQSSSYPDLFVANLAGVSNGCATTEGIDIQYPDPGSSVQNGNIGVDFGPPTGCTGGDTSTSSGGNSTSSGGSSAGSSVPESSPAATSAAAGSASAAAPSASSGGGFASGAGGASSAASPAAATSTAFVSPVPAATSAGAGSGSGGAAPSVATASAAAPSSTGAPSTSGAMAGSCTDGNAYYCLADGLSFQRCGSGTWTSPPTQMPAGTTCTPGMSDNFQEDVVATKVRRGAHHQRVRRSEKVWAA